MPELGNTSGAGGETSKRCVHSPPLTFEPLGLEHLEDLPEIQKESPGSARWPTGGYLSNRTLVAHAKGRVIGFLAFRSVDEDEIEILDLAIRQRFRRRGIATELLRRTLRAFPGKAFLEVRESNSAAIALYASLGFEVIATRSEYYLCPREDAVVMALQSC